MRAIHESKNTLGMVDNWPHFFPDAILNQLKSYLGSFIIESAQNAQSFAPI
jgi:hypothetical protein